MTISWSINEIELILLDYFNMLTKDLRDEKYSKAEHRRALMPLLANRSEGSIEFKHQNISAVLIKLGQPYIKGYLPRFNYQQLLEERVIDYLAGKANFESLFIDFADKSATQRKQTDFTKLIASAPKPDQVMEPQSSYSRIPVKLNYLEREQKNLSLGILGEELVLEYEKWNLKQEGKNKYAQQVKWISKEEGDGAGYDILSKDFSGNDKFIEVKTTKLSKKTPIYFSGNELDFSIANKDRFFLYRLFDFENNARMFIRQGALNQICHASPISYKGYF